MAREFAESFYNSRRWKKCRAAYIKYRQSIDGGLCETCHERPGYIVHHVVELSPDNIDDPDITVGFGNLKYECLRCHNEIHNPKREADPNLCRVLFDEVGDEFVIPPKNPGEVGA